MTWQPSRRLSRFFWAGFTGRLILRVLAGLLVGGGMFYFSKAHAQGPSCTGGQVQVFTVTSSPCSASGCAAGPANGTKYYSLAELNAANQARYSQGSVCSTYQFGGPYLWRASAGSYSGQTNALALGMCANDAGQDRGNASINASVTCGAAPPPPCPAAGTRAYHYFTSEPTPESCDNLCGYTAVTGPDAHRFTVDDTTTQSALYEATGNACTATVQSPDPVEPPNPCKVVQGNTVCTLEDDPLCITINGNKVCTSNNTAGFCTTAQCQNLAAALKLPDNTVVSTPDAVGAPLPYGSQTEARPADATIPTTSRTGPPTGTSGANTTSSPMRVHNPSTVAGSCTGPCSPGEVPGTDPDDEGAAEEGEEGGDGTFTSPTGEYGFEDGQAEIAAKRQELSQAFEAIRGEASQLFGPVGTGTAGLPVYTVETGCCGTVTFDFRPFSNALASVGAVLIFMSLVLSAFVMLGGGGKT